MAAPISQTASAPAGTGGRFDPHAIRAQFPALHQQAHGKPLVYLDSGATSQKPQAVIDAVRYFYEHDNANVHRGLYELSERATEAYEGARAATSRFLNAGSPREIVFTRGTTEAINLVAGSWGQANLKHGDRILISGMEHHANIVPWQMLCERTGAELAAIPVTDRGELDLEAFGHLLSDRTRLVAVTHISNVLGTINPVHEIVSRARRAGAKVLLDGAQAVPHQPVDVRALRADFYVFSGHKCFGPTGIGVLWARPELLDAMPPWQGGGDMIKNVTLEKTLYADPPQRFEAGTPPIAGAVGLAAAIAWLQQVDRAGAAGHEKLLLETATQKLLEFPGLKIIGQAPDKACMISFVIDGLHPHDAGMVLDRCGVAVRTGHHCAQPLMDRFKVPATLRASMALYNTLDDIEALVQGLHKARQLLS